MLWFKCKHPAESLIVLKAETREQYDECFDFVTYHLRCLKCEESVQIRYSAMRGGVEAFIKRGNKAAANT